jgi:type II secretory pathway pseudopilin PulG
LHYSRPLSAGAFTLIETLLGLTMISLFGAIAFWGLNTLNIFAVKARLYSQAIARAEQQIDAILTAGPFDLTTNPQQIPTALTLGSTQTNGVLVYKDPVTGQTIVTGIMITTITNTNTTQTVGTSTDLNIVRATVKINWTFRGYPYSVALDTMRTGNQ